MDLQRKQNNTDLHYREAFHWLVSCLMAWSWTASPQRQMTGTCCGISLPSFYSTASCLEKRLGIGLRPERWGLLYYRAAVLHNLILFPPLAVGSSHLCFWVSPQSLVAMLQHGLITIAVYFVMHGMYAGFSCIFVSRVHQYRQCCLCPQAVQVNVECLCNVSSKVIFQMSFGNLKLCQALCECRDIQPEVSELLGCKEQLIVPSG